MSQAELPSYLNCLMLTLSGRKLLLPNTAVAELVPYRHVEPTENAPEWLLGQLDWRGLRLPVISFEALCDGPVPSSENSHIVILNAIGGRKDFRFFAMQIQGIPRPVRQDKSLAADSTASLHKYEQQAVKVEGETLYIPELRQIEKFLLSSGVIG